MGLFRQGVSPRAETATHPARRECTGGNPEVATNRALAIYCILQWYERSASIVVISPQGFPIPELQNRQVHQPLIGSETLSAKQFTPTCVVTLTPGKIEQLKKKESSFFCTLPTLYAESRPSNRTFNLPPTLQTDHR
jgi:hypothetical protein